MKENICAISTALGVGAISIIRCSGSNVIEIVNKVFDSKDLTKVKSHTINYGHIVNNGEVIDEVLVSIMRAPKTFTKEDIVEINSHGGISTTNKILEILIVNGLRLADRGEFSKRAYLNGRIDLVEAEGINDLILAETEAQRKYAINRTLGNLSRLIIDNRKILVGLQAKLEVNFDYPEEADNIEMTHKLVLDDLMIIKDNLKKLLASSKDGKIIREGIDVAILGRPNVGKSSILNHLLDEEKAIVTNVAGTTRDIVEGVISLSGIKLNLIDTAGIRETDDIVEKIGVDKSLDISKKADLIIYVFNNNEKITSEEIELLKQMENVKKLVLINKSDLESNIDLSSISEYPVVLGNTVSKDGLDELKNKIIEMFNLDEIGSKNFNLLSNARQIALITSSLNSIEEAIKSVEEEVPLEMIATDIKEAYDLLGEIIGSTYKDELLDELFANFCLGK